MTNPVDRIAAHIVQTRYADLPPNAVANVKTFLLDTLGVGIAGSSGAQVTDLVALAQGWGNTPEATVWLTGDVTTAATDVTDKVAGALVTKPAPLPTSAV